MSKAFYPVFASQFISPCVPSNVILYTCSRFEIKYFCRCAICAASQSFFGLLCVLFCFICLIFIPQLVLKYVITIISSQSSKSHCSQEAVYFCVSLDEVACEQVHSLSSSYLLCAVQYLLLCMMCLRLVLYVHIKVEMRCCKTFQPETLFITC